MICFCENQQDLFFTIPHVQGLLATLRTPARFCLTLTPFGFLRACVMSALVLLLLLLTFGKAFPTQEETPPIKENNLLKLQFV